MLSEQAVYKQHSVIRTSSIQAAECYQKKQYTSSRVLSEQAVYMQHSVIRTSSIQAAQCYQNKQYTSSTVLSEQAVYKQHSVIRTSNIQAAHFYQNHSFLSLMFSFFSKERSVGCELSQLSTRNKKLMWLRTKDFSVLFNMSERFNIEMCKKKKFYRHFICS